MDGPGLSNTPNRVRPRPSAWWYVLVVLLPIAGFAAGFLFVRTGLSNSRALQREFTRQSVNERGLVTFDEPGAFTMYFHGPSDAFHGDVEELLTTLEIRFTEVATGESVALRPYESDAGTTRDGYRVEAIKTFRIERVGDYHLEVRTSDFRRDDAGVAVGPSQFEPLRNGALYGLAAAGAGLVAGAAACIAIAVQRGRWRWLQQRPR